MSLPPSGPLANVRIIELAGIGPGPMAAMLLAELGAEVLRIDRVSRPDVGIDLPANANFLLRSRPSIAVDLKHPQGLRLGLELVTNADALIEGFRPGVTERMGLGPDACQALNPRLVYGRVSGWGQYGPLASCAGHDLNYIALSGALDAIGRAEQAPTPPLNLVGDFGGGALYLALGVVAALFEARTSGRGQVVDAAITDGAASLMTHAYALHAAGLGGCSRGYNVLDSGAHYYETYQTADDRYISLAPIEPKFYRELLRLANLPIDSLPQSHNADDWPELKQRLAALIKTRTREQWCELLTGSDACFAPVLSCDEAPLHPHNQARQTFVARDGHWQPNAAPRFDRTPSQIRASPSRRGADTRIALGDWGISPDRIDKLLEMGVLMQAQSDLNTDQPVAQQKPA